MKAQDEDRIHAAIAKQIGPASPRAGQAVRLLADAAILMLTPRPLDDYHEDQGTALWWKFPICEPPYVGSPLDSDWPDYHTHWTPIVCPKGPADG